MPFRPSKIDLLEQQFRYRAITKRKTNRRQTTTGFPFLQLPREIRDHIYRELLCSDKIYKPATDAGIARRYEYQVAILQCNRQINNEATPVLYNENCFILFSLDWFIKNEELRKMVRPSLKALVGDDAVYKTLRQSAAAVVKLGSTTGGFTGTFTGVGDQFVITPWELHMTTQCLWIDLFFRQELVVILRCIFSFNLSFRQTRHQRTLFDGLAGLRGIPLTLLEKTEGLDPLGHQHLSSLFEQRYLRIYEFITRALAFESRGNDLLISADPDNEFIAYKNFLEGATYFEGFMHEDRPHHLLGRCSEETLQFLEDKQVWMNMACALYLIDRGSLRIGAKCFDKWVNKGKRRSVMSFARFGYYYGRVLLRHSYERQAIFFLMLALRARPGWPPAESKAYELSQRIKLMPEVKGKRISSVFKTVLAPLMNQPLHPLSAQELDGILANCKGELKLARRLTKVNDFCPSMIRRVN